MTSLTDPITIGKLRWAPLLSVLTDEEFQAFVNDARIIDFNIGDVIDSGTTDNAALWILMSGTARLAEPGAGNRTLSVLTEPGAFWSAELARRANVSAPSLIASGKTSVLNIQAASIAALGRRSEKFEAKLDLESSILRSFLRLRATARFSDLDFSRFRPFLSQGGCISFGAGELFDRSLPHDGISIILEGSVAAKQNNQDAVLQPGDWFTAGNLFPFPHGIASEAKAISTGELFRVSAEAYATIRQLNPELTAQIDLLLLNPATQGTPAALQQDLLARVNARPASMTEKPAAISESDEPLVPKLRRKFKQYPHVYQHSELECGITCLHMICLFYGKKVSLIRLRELCEIGRSGSSMLDLAEAAEQLGFVSRGVRASTAGLPRLRLPLILYWKKNHFVVLYEINASHAVVGDPAEGLITIPLAQFRIDYAERALELTPTVCWFEQKLQAIPLWHTLYPVIEPHRKLVRDILVCSFLFQLLLLIAPVFTQIVLDQVIVHQDLDTLNILLLGMIVLAVFQAVMGYLRQFFLAFLALKTDQGLFTELFNRLFSLPLEYFNKHSTGDTLTRFGESAGVVQFLTGVGAITLLDIAMAIVYLFTVFLYSTSFGLATVAYVTVLSLFLLFYAPMLKRLSQSAYDKEVSAQSFLVEAIRGVEQVKSAAAERRTRWKWETLFQEKLNVKFQEALAAGMSAAFVRFFQLGGQIGFLWLGTHMVIAKELTIGQLMAMTMLTTMIAQPFIRLSELSQMFQTVSVAIERLAEVLLEKPEEQDPLSKMQLTEVRGHIKFEQICYRYSGHDSGNALNNVSFEAKPGQMIGIVGRSGSGKSTLTRLIQGLYVPTDGRIYVDGVDLSQVLLSTYRRRIGVVSQTEYFFHGTVRENISFYKPEATMQEIVRACTVAGINDFFSSLPSGYETVLNEGADNFSGGQRQCMAIARCLLHNPAILIFDEATSAMDSETERCIQECMETLRKRSTMFVVAHRLSTIMSADLILVVDQGQVVESGTHESLMQLQGLYYYLCKKQTLNV